MSRATSHETLYHVSGDSSCFKVGKYENFYAKTVYNMRLKAVSVSQIHVSLETGEIGLYLCVKEDVCEYIYYS